MTRADDSTEQTVETPRPDVPLPAFSAAPAFHSDDVQHVADYKSLSVLALLSLLIGLAAPLCFLSKGFLLLPLCGLAISILALRQIALSEGRLAGRWAAVLGLVLCVACGVGSISLNSTTRYLRSAQAEEFARSWLAKVVSNDLELAFKSTYDGARPASAPEPGKPVPEKSPYETFLSDPLIQKISAAGKDAIIVCDDTLEFTPLTRREFIVRQRFLITPGGDATKSGAADPIEAVLTMQRSHFHGDRKTRWLVVDYEPSDAPPH